MDRHTEQELHELLAELEEMARRASQRARHHGATAQGAYYMGVARGFDDAHDRLSDALAKCSERTVK